MSFICRLTCQEPPTRQSSERPQVPAEAVLLQRLQVPALNIFIQKKSTRTGRALD